MNSNVRTVILDFDYTLADSSRGVFESIKFALSKLSLPEAGYEAVCKTIGLPLRQTLVELAGADTEKHAADFAKYFVEKADEVMADATTLFDFVPGALTRLKALDLSLGIVSTKFAHRIDGILRRESLQHVFDVIIGGADVDHHKPHPESLLLAINKLGASMDSVIYVGDSRTDAETAQRAGVPFIAVLSGVTPREAFEATPCLEVLDSVADLAGWLTRPGKNEGADTPGGRQANKS